MTESPSFILLFQQKEYELLLDDEVTFIMAETVAGDMEEKVFNRYTCRYTCVPELVNRLVVLMPSA